MAAATLSEQTLWHPSIVYLPQGRIEKFELLSDGNDVSTNTEQTGFYRSVCCGQRGCLGLLLRFHDSIWVFDSFRPGFSHVPEAAMVEENGVYLCEWLMFFPVTLVLRRMILGS